MTKLLSFHCKYIYSHCPIKVCFVLYYFIFIILLDACLLSKEREKESVWIWKRGTREDGTWETIIRTYCIEKCLFSIKAEYCRHPGPLFYKGSSSQSTFGFCFFVLAWISFCTCILRYYFMFLLAIIFINLFRVCYYVNRLPVDTLD